MTGPLTNTEVDAFLADNLPLFDKAAAAIDDHPQDALTQAFLEFRRIMYPAVAQ
jgi:hypothetical protein